MSKHAIDCFAEILDAFAEGQIEDPSDLHTILMAWDFVDEDCELTRRGQAMFVGEVEEELR